MNTRSNTIAELQKENEELKESVDQDYQFRVELGDIMEEHDISRDEQIDLVFERILQENKNLKEENKNWENIHSGDMKIVKMLKENWNEEQEKNKKLKELNTTLQYQYDMAIQIDNKEIAELKEHLECEEDGYPCSTWFSEKLDFHIKYHFCNEGGEYYETLKDLQEKPNCLDDLIYGSLERTREDNKKLKKFKTDVADALHFDDDLEDEDYIDGVKELENDVACFVIKDEEPSLNELKLLLKTKEQEKTIARLTKERNYLGDYQGGATSEEEEDE